VPLLYAQSMGARAAGFTPEMLDLAVRMDAHNGGHFLRRFPPARRLPRPLLASPRAVWKGLVAPHRTTPEMVLTGLLGEGLLSTSSAGEVVRTALPRGWPRARLRIATLDLSSGRRVVFGAEDAAVVDLHTAVLAAVSIPGFFAPVQIGDRRCVDAGSLSPSNLDVLADADVDVALCINPLSGADVTPRSSTMLGRLGNLARARADRRLAIERRRLEERGCRVFVIHPGAADRAAMSSNFMDIGTRADVVQVAARTVADALGRPELAELKGALEAAAHAHETRNMAECCLEPRASVT
jgi:NTE family protein